jgi:NADPH:quinone reductase-like Zn-dependent oxidoreductase
METADAWVLYSGPPREPAELRREILAFEAIADDEVLVEPLFGCWEGNMSHAIARDPVDVCRHRREEKITIGNCGVVRVLEIGSRVTTLAPGDLCLGYVSYKNDPHGYMLEAPGFDIRGTMGLLAKRTKMAAAGLLKIPADSRYSLAQWAGWPFRFPTAWSNWKVAHGAYRLQMTEEDMPSPHVWGWGGGTTMAELDLARRFGCRTAMTASTDARLAEITAHGIRPLDRRAFSALSFDRERHRADREYRAHYDEAERTFLGIVHDVTEGAGVSIFVDYIGTPVHRATLKALGRQGVIATAGWKRGMEMSTNRAMTCLQRNIHVHTHYARASEIAEALQYSLEADWMPPAPSRIYTWEEIPELARRMANGEVDGAYAIYEINPGS